MEVKTNKEFYAKEVFRLTKYIPVRVNARADEFGQPLPLQIVWNGTAYLMKKQKNPNPCRVGVGFGFSCFVEQVAPDANQNLFQAFSASGAIIWL